MSKGRNTTTITVRLADVVVETLKYRAVQVGMGYTVLARDFIIEGLRKAHKDLVVGNLREYETKPGAKVKGKSKGKRKRRH